jgi:hypothetical protein
VLSFALQFFWIGTFPPKFGNIDRQLVAFHEIEFRS